MPSAPASDIVALARAWIGTPYHHQASACQAGCDCLGLIRGVYRAHMGRDAEVPPPYSRDWAEVATDEAMIAAATRHLIPVPIDELGPGTILIFRLKPGMVAKHAAILATAATMIHATEGAPVAEVAFAPWWRRRLAAAFALPPQPHGI